VRRIVEPQATDGPAYETTSRPYPSGGAVYDLELYLTVGACAGLDRGIYHYDPLGHGARRLTTGGADVDALLRDAQFAAGLADEPPVVVTLTSRFQRVSWKYSGLAYALALKNVGVLFQTMYLVATAMDLAPCALGTGDSDLFQAATGRDPFTEPAVGEFLLGNSPRRG
jgi:SagB-type dehydrogenase family enzyme